MLNHMFLLLFLPLLFIVGYQRKALHNIVFIPSEILTIGDHQMVERQQSQSIFNQKIPQFITYLSLKVFVMSEIQ